MNLKTIDEILLEIREDKVDNPSTTSFQFKRDLWDFFQGFQHKNCVEFGTHKGQTTRILSYLFKTVYTVNLPGHFNEAMELNKDRENILYKPMDLYETPVEKNFPHKQVSVFFIDAEHSFDAIMTDISRCLNFKLDPDGDIYFIFDDYGAYREVWIAINQLIRVNRIEKVKYIGHEPRHTFGGASKAALQDYEGIICKLIK